MDRKRTAKYVGVTIRKFKHKSVIQIQFKYNDMTCRENLDIPATEANKKFANAKRLQILAEIERGVFNYSDHFPKSKSLAAKLFGNSNVSTRMETLFNDYLKKFEKTLELSTFVSYRKIINSRLIPEFGKIPVKHFSASSIRDFILKLEVKPKTIRNMLIPLRNVIELALNDKLITENPFNKIAINKLLNIENHSHRKAVIEPFTRAEIEEIFKTAGDTLRPQLKFWFFTGLRPSEFFALNWEDIDFINQKAFIWRTTVYGKTKDRTKTKQGTREIQLLPPALQALKEQKALTFLRAATIFTNPKNSQVYVRDKQFREWVWRPLLLRAGVRYRHPYNIRHTFASMMLTAGENIAWLSKNMGHADVETTLRVYAKFIPDHSITAGYQTKNDWDNFLKENGKIARIEHATKG